MPDRLILASSSQVRARLLRDAGVVFETCAARVDEVAVRASLATEGAPARDVADTLAELKARRVADRVPGALVIGCDQVLEHQRRILAKPESPQEARGQLRGLAGDTHRLFSAAVIYDDGRPVWRHIGTARLTMRGLSDEAIDAYVDRNWDSIRHSVGGYKIEEEGARLFTQIDGDFFSVLGLPLLDVLSWLTLRGILRA